MKVAKAFSKEPRAFNHNQQSPYWMSRPLSIIATPPPLSLLHLNPLISDLVSIHLIHMFSFFCYDPLHFPLSQSSPLLFWPMISPSFVFLISLFFILMPFPYLLLWNFIITHSCPNHTHHCSLIYTHTLASCGTPFSSYFFFLH